jgi:hypothetical protein
LLTMDQNANRSQSEEHWSPKAACYDTMRGCSVLGKRSEFILDTTNTYTHTPPHTVYTETLFCNDSEKCSSPNTWQAHCRQLKHTVSREKVSELDRGREFNPQLGNYFIILFNQENKFLFRKTAYRGTVG